MCTLRYSRLLSLPIFGYLVYFFQLVLIQFQLTNTFYLSAKEKKVMKFIVFYLEKKAAHFEVQDFRLGHVLTFFSKPIMLNLDGKAISIENDVVYQRALWTLVSCSSLTLDTKKVLGHYLGDQILELYE